MATATPILPAQADTANTNNEEAQLDAEIASIRAQIKLLSQRRSTLTSTLIGSRSTRSLLQRVSKNDKNIPSQNRLEESPDSASNSASDINTALERATKQTKYSQTCLYRMCAGATMFEVRDPDPHAVDGRKVFGIRLEVSIRDKFLPPYYLLLNRPYAHAPAALHIHRHTVPPCIPLSALAAKYLPPPAPAPSSSSLDVSSAEIQIAKPHKSSHRPQHLSRLVRELRREIVAYHLRRAALEELRDYFNSDPGFASISSAAGSGAYDIIDITHLHPQTSSNTTTHDHESTHTNTPMTGTKIKAISAADAEITDIQILWTNGSLGRIKLQRNGKLVQCIVYSPLSTSGLDSAVHDGTAPANINGTTAENKGSGKVSKGQTRQRQHSLERKIMSADRIERLRNVLVSI